MFLLSSSLQLVSSLPSLQLWSWCCFCKDSSSILSSVGFNRILIGSKVFTCRIRTPVCRVFYYAVTKFSKRIVPCSQLWILDNFAMNINNILNYRSVYEKHKTKLNWRDSWNIRWNCIGSSCDAFWQYLFLTWVLD